MTTKKLLASAYNKAVYIAANKDLVVLQPDRISIWVGEDDETWDEGTDTYTSEAEGIRDTIEKEFGLTWVSNGSKFDMMPVSLELGNYNDVSSAWHY